MSVYIRSWQADGPDGEAELRHVQVLKVKADHWPIIGTLNADKRCVRVTLEISGLMPNGKPRPFRTLWRKPGYRDPFGNDGQIVLKRVFVPA